MVTAAALALYIALLFCNSPRDRTGRFPHRRPSTTVIAETGGKFGSFGNVYSEVVYPRTCFLCPKTPLLPQTGVLYSHSDFDPIAFTPRDGCPALSGALCQNGTTITKQVAKNLPLVPQKYPPPGSGTADSFPWLESKFSKIRF